MGQMIWANEVYPIQVFHFLSCDGPCRGRDWAVYTNGDFITKRGAAYADGWRRRNNQWFLGSCVPKGKDDAD